MNLIGLTGGIGMGKTTVANLLHDDGLPVIDTDVLAREVVEPGQPAWEEIRQSFGSAVIGPDDQIRRDELARMVFSDEARRKQLEEIVHPRIHQRWLTQAEEWRRQNQACGVVVIPLLFETGSAASFNTIICVACSAATQQERLLPRGWDLQQIQRRNKAQWPVEKKISLAHYVIWTEGSLEVLCDQVQRILLGLR